MGVKYIGNIAKSVRAWCDKHPNMVREVYYADGYSNGYAYDILLEPGWSAYGDTVHTIIEDTAKDALRALKEVSPCDCDDCRGGW